MNKINNILHDKKKKVGLDFRLNAEISRIQKKNKVNSEIGTFTFKHPDFYRIKRSLINKNVRAREVSTETENKLKSRIVVSHKSNNRNSDNYQGFIYDNDLKSTQSNYTKMNYKSNFLGQHKLNKVLDNYMEILILSMIKIKDIVEYMKKNGLIQ